MDIKNGLTRAKTLIRRGRYTKHTIKNPTGRFIDVDSIDVVKLEGAEWMPYYDTLRDQVVYGYYDQRDKGPVFHYLAFLAFDYHYSAKSPFDWIDDDFFGFKNLD